MKLNELKVHFAKQLKNEYPTREVDSFFYRLVEEFLGMSRLETTLNQEKQLTKPREICFEEALKRLLKHEPIQYITGKTEFYGLECSVNSNVLIPRAETEELVDWVVKDSKFKVQNSRLNIIDLGTGSGCIAIALAKNIKNARLSACDISEKALHTAVQNARKNKVKIDFFSLDILKEELPGEFHIIISNPPYVRELEKKDMQRNVLDHEPASALYVKNEDPLIFYQKIAGLATKNLKKTGKVYLEINEYLAPETRRVFTEKGFQTEVKKDIFGKNRMLKAWF